MNHSTLETRTEAGRGALLTTAVAGFALFLLGWATPPDGPALGGGTAAQVRAFVAGQDVAIRVGATTGTLVAVGLIVFTSALAAQVRRVSPASTLADLIAGSGVVLALIQLLTTAAYALPRLLPGLVGTELSRVPDGTVQDWFDVNGLTHFLADLQLAPAAVAMLAASIAALRLAVLPRWLGWTGAVLAVAAAVGTLGITLALDPLYPLWFVGLFGFWLWVVLVASVCTARDRRLRRLRRAEQAEAAETVSEVPDGVRPGSS
jgi:hypothetical protein